MQRERACALPFLTAPAQVFAVAFETNIFNKDYRPVGIQRNTVGNLNSERRLLKFAADDIIIAAVSFLSAVLFQITSQKAFFCSGIPKMRGTTVKRFSLPKLSRARAKIYFLESRSAGISVTPRPKSRTTR